MTVLTNIKVIELKYVHSRYGVITIPFCSKVKTLSKGNISICPNIIERDVNHQTNKQIYNVLESSQPVFPRPHSNPSYY